MNTLNIAKPMKEMSCGPNMDILGILLLQLMVTSLIAEFVIE